MAKAPTKSPKPRKVKRRRAITPEDLTRFHYVASPQIAPDGSAIVFVEKHVGAKNDYDSNLWMVGTDGQRNPRHPRHARQFTSGGKDSHPRWSHDGSTIAFIGGRTKGRPQIFTIDPEGGEAVALTTLPEGSIGTFKWSRDNSMLAVSFRPQEDLWTQQAVKDRTESGASDPPRVLDHYWYRLDGDGYFNAQRFAVYIVDVATGEHRVLYNKDALGYMSFDWSPDSRQLVVASNRDKRALLKDWDDELLRINVKTGKITAIPNLPSGPKECVCYSPNGKYLAYAGRVGPDSSYSVENLELFICDPTRGKAKSLTARQDYCLLAPPLTDTAEVAFAPNVQWSPDSRRIYMKIGWRGESHVASVRPGGGKIAFHTSGVVDQDVGNISANGKMIALTLAAATKLPEVGVATLGATPTKATVLTTLNGALLKEVETATITSHWVKATDGHKTQVWVMKPPGFKSGRKYPAILEIHGGPHAQYGVGFFHEFQLLAANGYVVFYSNPRGSKGYGRDHCAPIKGNWGSVDWIDIEAVTEFMQSQRFVDKKRMGVMGGSYGGYMTNWAIGHTNVFAGAITDRCVSNMVSMFGSSDFLSREDDYFPGNAWDRPEALWEQSPLKYLGNAKTPTLIIHSEGDLRCNVEQSEQVYNALTVKRVPTRFVRYPRTTSHGMSRGGPPDMRQHRLHQILDWWQRWLKGQRGRR